MTVARVSKESAVRLRLMSAPANPAEMGPFVGTMSTALSACANQALLEFSVNTKSLNALRGEPLS